MFFQASKIILCLTLQSAWKASSLPFPKHQEILESIIGDEVLESTIGDDGRSWSVTKREISCLVEKVHVLYEDHSEAHWNCNVKDRAILRALGTKSNTFQILGEEVNDFLEKGEESEDAFSGIWSLTLSSGVEVVPETQDLKVEMSHILSFNDAKAMFLDKKASSVDRAVDSGDLKALVVRVTTNDSSPSSSASKLANDIFEDALNLRSQFAACSYNKVNIYPSTSALPGNLKYSATGVIDIRINVNANGNSENVLENAARTRVADLFGLNDHDDMEDLFDLVLYVQPPGTGSWLAYAYMRKFDSYYNDYWSGSVSTLVHEVGHNMNLRHSGIPGSEYGDQIGAMGFGYNEDDAPRQCFNSPKNWQLGWYDDKRLDLNVRSELRSGPKRYVLNGVADYKNGSASNYIVIKIGELYIGYNRADGINSGTLAARNRVTIHEKLGAPYKDEESTRLAILDENQSFSSSKENVRISFLGTTNGLRDAIVEISLLEEDNNPCDGDLEVVLKTDLYPGFTYWGIYDPEADRFLYVGDGYRKKEKTYSEKIHGLCRDKTYRFVILSRQNIGLCCKYGEGYFQGKHDGKVLFEGAEFTDRMDIDFVIPSSDPTPTPLPPTRSPTNPPQPAPTNPPQPSPTNPPQPTPDSGACDGDPERQFQLELRTDSYGSETSWAIFIEEGQDIVEDPVYYGLDYESNTLYTLPSEDEFYCLELERCYWFAIFDSYGDGMGFGENTGYKGFLGGDEIFSGDGTFDNDGEYDAHRFCVGDGGTLPPTVDPSFTSTILGTDPGDSDPTASPTSSPTPAPTPSPTPAPTPSPTPAPTPSPTVSATTGSSSSTTGCFDDPDFRFKGKKNKTCKKFLKGKNKNKLRKKCKKKWRGKKVMDWCPETCGTKVGLGRCDYLQA